MRLGPEEQTENTFFLTYKCFIDIYIFTFQKYICIMFNSITHRNQCSGDQNSELNVTFVVLEKEMATHSSTLAQRVPWREEPGRLQPTGSQSQTRLSDFTFTFCGFTVP